MPLSKSLFSKYQSNLALHIGKVDAPMVSICLNTFNQQHYIEQCLAGILGQKANFDFELIIGDDGSKDNNCNVITDYLNNYDLPKNLEVKAYYHKQNLGPSFALGKDNFLHAFFNARGKYIVHIEGDDYFTDDKKLQKQVDFLEKNAEFSACFHNTTIKWENKNPKPDELLNPENQKDIIETADLLAGKEVWFMATASVMMRRKFVETLPDWFYKSVSGDIPLYVILSTFGPIGYMPDIMAVYRKNDAGLSFYYQQNDAHFIKNRIAMYKGLNQLTNGKYKANFDKIFADYYTMMVHCKQYQFNIFKRSFFAWKAAHYQNIKNFTEIKLFIKQHALNWQHLSWSNIKKWFITDLFIQNHRKIDTSRV